MNNKITERRSMNLAICKESLAPFKDRESLKSFYEECGLTGLEVIRTWDPDEGKITPDMVRGVHLFFHVFWLDWWKGNFARMDEEFDSREQWIEYFGGTTREAYLKSLRDDLDYAQAMGAEYVVFHVGEATMEECFSYQYYYSDEEVIEGALEVIRELFHERQYSFEFLVENLWYSGMNLLNPKLTGRLLEGIPTKKKGIMLDTGHFMNTNTSLTTPEEAVAYLHEMLDQYEKENMLSWFRGIHLHMSLSGEYRRATLKDPTKAPEKIAKLPFYDRYRVVTEHTRNLDRHKPFLEEGVRGLVERIHPAYITYEFQADTKEEYREMALRQSKELGVL